MHNNISITPFVIACRSAPQHHTELFAKNALEAVKTFMLTAEGKAKIEQRIAENRRNGATQSTGG